MNGNVSNFFIQVQDVMDGDIDDFMAAYLRYTSDGKQTKGGTNNPGQDDE